jgi:hypothetical protein
VQRKEALQTAREAVALRRELAQRNREAFLPDLADAYGRLGQTSLAAKLNREAEQAFAEGRRLMLAYLTSHDWARNISLAETLLDEYVLAVKESLGKPDEQPLADANRVLGRYHRQEKSQRLIHAARRVGNTTPPRQGVKLTLVILESPSVSH